MIEAQVSRRDVLKFSALGAAALTLPLERAVRAKTVSQIAASKLPAPYTLPFAVPPVVDGRGGGTVTLHQLATKATIIPGFQTTIFGYAYVDPNRPGTPPVPTTPGPTIHAKRGTLRAPVRPLATGRASASASVSRCAATAGERSARATAVSHRRIRWIFILSN